MNSKAFTPTDFRKNLYTILDSVITTGNPQRIARKGKTLKLIVEDAIHKLDNLKSHNVIVGDPDELVNLKLTEWEESKKI